MSDLKNTDAHEWSDLHAEIQDWLAGYADGELDEHHTALVEAHLAGCETCQQMLNVSEFFPNDCR
ncbi:anti-sigma factor family protein [Vreelandella lionensis]|uniref:anti-sigma factor family protein n=1 Tax=Vreelandella lionensis TaxID=1144478 RepID=UPI0009F4B45A|nr:zf-HC2 domain-containing protein [Halomonas lionensis]